LLDTKTYYASSSIRVSNLLLSFVGDMDFVVD
jgi:hypothetical protein